VLRICDVTRVTAGVACRPCTISRSVRLARKIVGILLLGVLLGYPAMACLSTAASEMREAERECCKHMAPDCGSINMPASHSCCQVQVWQQNSMLNVASSHLAPPAAIEITTTDQAGLRTAASEFSFFQLHPPPESPPGASSILRI